MRITGVTADLGAAFGSSDALAVYMIGVKHFKMLTAIFASLFSV